MQGNSISAIYFRPRAARGSQTKRTDLRLESDQFGEGRYQHIQPLVQTGSPDDDSHIQSLLSSSFPYHYLPPLLPGCFRETTCDYYTFPNRPYRLAPCQNCFVYASTEAMHCLKKNNITHLTAKPDAYVSVTTFILFSSNSQSPLSAEQPQTHTQKTSLGRNGERSHDLYNLTKASPVVTTWQPCAKLRSVSNHFENLYGPWK